MNTHCEEVIITTELRGDGKDMPYRRVVQVFTKDGQLIAEYDPILREELMKLLPFLDSPRNKVLANLTVNMQ